MKTIVRKYISYFKQFLEENTKVIYLVLVNRG